MESHQASPSRLSRESHPAKPTETLFGGWQYRQIVQLFVQNLGDCLLGEEHYQRILSYGERKTGAEQRSLRNFGQHVHWNTTIYQKWRSHPQFSQVLTTFFTHTDGSETQEEQEANGKSRAEDVISRFDNGEMEFVFEEVVSVIDHGGLYDQYTMDTKTERYVELVKFFTPLQCAKNEINLTAVLYTKLSFIVQHFINDVSSVETSPQTVNMVLICCMLLVGQASAITASGTPWLLNAFLVMTVDSSEGSMRSLSLVLQKDCNSLYQMSWTMGLLKIKQSDQEEEITSSMTIEEGRAYKRLLNGGNVSNEMYTRLRTLSIMMMSEGIIVQSDGVTRLLRGQIAGDEEAVREVEGFLRIAETKNGFIRGQRRNRLLVWLARLYLVVTAALSIFVAAENVGNRDNLFERITDGLATVTACWFTMLGLRKVQSDDEKIIRHMVLGIIPIQHADELVSYLQTDAETLKVALSRNVQDYAWLSPNQCCFVKGKAIGNLEVLGGLDAFSCDRAGLLEVDKGVVYDVVNAMLGQGKKDGENYHVMGWSRSTKWFIANRVPDNCVVAGS
ncbi:hypothetical protein BWQ96_01107 [Gracilariopsis chorda]|uniref:Uncharacterized protein n=1 Tax=Gracilariopsis chorda TaxID=448386 RepID=A0A2V3J416_9FLOR|nr:hypothetical protein BWQ96_01107 [Gracilariopsis chorda]|eukprot:PXF49158.1 hypothetical protein BWQ96_01107 [Gracilariopsis chorda]